jgi:hypothetical protein
MADTGMDNCMIIRNLLMIEFLLEENSVSFGLILESHFIFVLM